MLQWLYAGGTPAEHLLRKWNVDNTTYMQSCLSVPMSEWWSLWATKCLLVSRWLDGSSLWRANMHFAMSQWRSLCGSLQVWLPPWMDWIAVPYSCLPVTLLKWWEVHTTKSMLLSLIMDWTWLLKKTEGWILPLLTAEQQFYTQKPFFSLDSGAQNLMHCKSHPLLPFPPPPLFCILFCDIFFLYLSIFKENLCIFHLQKYYQIYAAIYTPYTYKSEDPYCSLRKWLCTVKSLPFLTPGKLIKTCYTASHD